MKSFSLSVYEVTINRYLRKEELQNLSDYDNGKNFLKEFDSMFLSWKKDLARSVVKDAEAKKASRIKKIPKENGYTFIMKHMLMEL